ncbi:MAG: CBS domain-containing protein [Proteobacteria bacterium]|nr:MAG: CBS domain-containing protein [Pseudomonadota bacterium]
MLTPLSKLLEEKGADVLSVAPDASVADCVRKMNTERIGALIVMDGSKPVGIFTERDVMTRVLDAERDVKTTKVSEVMSPDLACVASSTTVGEALQIISEKRFRHLPVVDDGVVTGMVSIGDLTHWLVRGQEQEIKYLVNYIAGNY